MVLLASFISKCLIPVPLIRQLMHEIFLSHIMYHQPCKMSPAQNGRVLSAPLGMTHTQQDTCEAREVQSLQGSQKFLLILFGMGWIQGWFAWGCSAVCETLSENHGLNSGLWALPDTVLELGSASLGTNKGAQEAPSFPGAPKKRECWECSFLKH